MPQSIVNFDFVTYSSMHVNIASYLSRNGYGFVDNRGGLYQEEVVI